MSQTDTWTATVSLEESQILSEQSDSFVAGVHVVRSQGSQAMSTDGAGRLVLERTKASGRRTRLRGRLLDDRGSMVSEFDTEYSVNCLITPQMLGVVANGHADPSSPQMTQLVSDSELRSTYCAKFSDLLK